MGSQGRGGGGIKSPPPGFFFYILFYSVRHPYCFLSLDCPVFCLLSLYLQHNTNIHAPCAIRTRNPSNRQAANPRLKPFDHWDRRDSILEPSRSQQVAIPTMLSRPTFISQTKVNSKHQLPSTSVLLKYEYNKTLFKAFLL